MRQPIGVWAAYRVRPPKWPVLGPKIVKNIFLPQNDCRPFGMVNGACSGHFGPVFDPFSSFRCLALALFCALWAAIVAILEAKMDKNTLLHM